MVSCSVVGCKNRSDNASIKKNNISFHLFPKEPERLQVWIKASCKPDSWLPTTRSVICSQHFDENCVFYRTNKRFLYKSAVPTLKLCQNVDITPSSGDNGDVDTKVPVSFVASASSILDMCRVCLTSNYNMPSMTEQELEMAYEQLTGIDFKKYIYLPDRLCVECSRKLKDFQKFREESLRSHSIMLNDCKKHNYIKLKRNDQNEIEQEMNEVSEVIVKEEMCDLLEEKEELRLKKESDDECSLDPISIQPAEIPNTTTQNFKIEFDVELLNENDTKLNSLEVEEESPTNTLEDLQFSSEEDEGEGEVFEVENEEDLAEDLIECSLDPISIQPAEIPNTTTQNFKIEFDVELLNENDTKLNSLEVEEESPTNTLEDLQFSSEEDEGEGEVFEVENEEDLAEDLIEKEEKKTKNNIQKPKTETKTETKAETKTETNNTPTKRERKRKEITVRKGTRWSFLNNVNVLNMFDISKLSLEEQRADVEKRQETLNYKNALFRCTECYKGFLDENAFNTHMTRHSNVDGEFICNACKIHFKNRNAAKKHETAHHGHRFSCKQCPLVTTHRNTANMHMKWHGGSSYTCPHCPEVFTVFSTYLGHIRKKHPSGFACDLCGYSFLSLKGVFLHKKVKHRNDDRTVPEDGPFCEPCNIRFLDDDVYNKHLRVSRKHTLNPDPNEPKKQRKIQSTKNRKVGDYSDPKPCEQCGMQLENAQAYHSHFRRMHPEKNRTHYRSMSMFMCEQCGKMFNSKQQLLLHSWVHTGEKAFRCEECGKGFTTKYIIEQHMRIHHESQANLRDHAWVHTSEMPYKCDVCDKRFQMKQQWRTHKYAHETKRFECDQCDKKCSTQNNLRRHKYVHSGIRPYKCDLCDKRFTDTCVRKAHVNHEHLKKPYPKRKHPRKKRSPTEQTVTVNEDTYNMDL